MAARRPRPNQEMLHVVGGPADGKRARKLTAAEEGKALQQWSALKAKDAPLMERFDALFAFIVALGAAAEASIEAFEQAGTRHGVMQEKHAKDHAYIDECIRRRVRQIGDGPTLGAAMDRAFRPMHDAVLKYGVTRATLEKVAAVVDRLCSATFEAVPVSNEQGEIAQLIELALRGEAERIRDGVTSLDDAEAHIERLLRYRPDALTRLNTEVGRKALRAALTARPARRGQPKKADRNKPVAAEAVDWFLRVVGFTITPDARRKAATRRRKKNWGHV